MKDMLGQEVSLCDVVVYKHRWGGRNVDLRVGKVVRETPKMVEVYKYGLVASHNCVKVADKFYVPK